MRETNVERWHYFFMLLTNKPDQTDQGWKNNTDSQVFLKMSLEAFQWWQTAITWSFSMSFPTLRIERWSFFFMLPANKANWTDQGQKNNVSQVFFNRELFNNEQMPIPQNFLIPFLCWESRDGTVMSSSAIKCTAVVDSIGHEPHLQVKILQSMSLDWFDIEVPDHQNMKAAINHCPHPDMTTMHLIPIIANPQKLL